MAAQIVGKKTFGSKIPAFPSPLGAGSKGMELPSIQEGLLGFKPHLHPGKHLVRDGSVWNSSDLS